MTGDLLIRLALEHRDLAVACRALRQRTVEQRAEAVRDAANRIVEHELAHRLLVHPLLARDRRGRQLLRERREEQLLLADRLRHTLTAFGAVPGDDEERAEAADVDAARDLDAELTAHTDREEIVSFPHVRRSTAPDELRELGEVRARLRGALEARLLGADSLVIDGQWATTRARDLASVLELPDELDVVVDLTQPARTSH